MLTGELLKLLENSAGVYRERAVDSIFKNARMNELRPADLKKTLHDRDFVQRVVDAVLVDYLNHVAGNFGGDLGLRVGHIKTRASEGADEKSANVRLGEVRKADCKRCGKETSHAVSAYPGRKNKDISFYLTCTLCLKKIHLTRLPVTGTEFLEKILGADVK